MEARSSVWEERLLLLLSAGTLTFSHQCRQKTCDPGAENSPGNGSSTWVISLWWAWAFAEIDLRLYFLILGDLALSFAPKMQPKTVPKLNRKEVWPDENDLNATKVK